MKLTAVSTSEVQMTATGKWISCKVAMTLEEYSEGKTSALVDSKGNKAAAPSNPTSGGGSARAQKATSNYKATIAAKKAAMDATASKSDKAQKNGKQLGKAKNRWIKGDDGTMRANGNGAPNVCASNLLRLIRGEVPLWPTTCVP